MNGHAEGGSGTMVRSHIILNINQLMQQLFMCANLSKRNTYKQKKSRNKIVINHKQKDYTLQSMYKHTQLEHLFKNL